MDERGHKRDFYDDDDEDESSICEDYEWPSFLRRMDPRENVEWAAIAALDRVPEDPIRLGMLMFVVRQSCARFLPRAFKSFSSRRQFPVSQEDRYLATNVTVVANMLNGARISRRKDLCEPIFLKHEKFAGEPFSLCIQLWSIECQCRALAYYAASDAADHRTSNDFPVLNQHLSVKTRPDLAIADYPFSRLQFAMLRVMSHWDSIPIVDPDFVKYLIALRIRASILSSMGCDESELDDPLFRKFAGMDTRTPVRVYRASLEMLQQMETMFYHLDKFIAHDRGFLALSAPIPETMCSDADAQYLKKWLADRVDTVFLDAWRRDTNNLCVMNSSFPAEREVFRNMNLGEGFEMRALLKHFKEEKLDRIQRLFVSNATEMMRDHPMMAHFSQIMLLMQGLSGAFDLSTYIYFSCDVANEASGADYPQPEMFLSYDYPVIYCPATPSHYWVIYNQRVYDCGSNYLKALAALLRLCFGLCPREYTSVAQEAIMAERFKEIRTVMKHSNDLPPVVFPSIVQPSFLSHRNAEAYRGNLMFQALKASMAAEEPDDDTYVLNLV